MKFIKTPLKGAFVIQMDPQRDFRGFFSRAWDAKEFSKRGLDGRLVQSSISFNVKRGTLRGLHYQKNPHGEAKLVRCTQGEIFDVIVDLRPRSHTFKKWFGVRLSAKNRSALFIPKGFAHGFITLSPNAEVFYQMSHSFVPKAARGARWNDPRFCIRWPARPRVMSVRDRSYPDFKG